MVILIAFVLAPLGAGFVLEYLVCRLSMGHGRLWKLLPPILAAALLFVPGLPALLGFLGLLAGWLAWRRMWLPRVVRNKQSE